MRTERPEQVWFLQRYAKLTLDTVGEITDRLYACSLCILTAIAFLP